MRVSKSGSRCQLSVAPRWRAVLHNPDKNCRHRGNDEIDAPLLLEGNAGAGEGDVVRGREQGDQAEGQSSDGLREAEAVKTETVESAPEAWGCRQVWRNLRVRAIAAWCVGWWRGGGDQPVGRPSPPVPPLRRSVPCDCLSSSQPQGCALKAETSGRWLESQEVGRPLSHGSNGVQLNQ